MKNGLIILITVAFVFFLYDVYCKGDSATKADLETVKKELKQQIDSVLQNCDSLKSELRTVRKNTDTLKAGQEVIFKTMQENKNKSFLDFLNF